MKLTDDQYDTILTELKAVMDANTGMTAEQIEEHAASRLGLTMSMEEALDGALQAASDAIGMWGTREQIQQAFGDSASITVLRVVWGVTFDDGDGEDSVTSERTIAVELADSESEWEAAERTLRRATELEGDTFSELFECEHDSAWIDHVTARDEQEATI
jgi:hypothetical protein